MQLKAKAALNFKYVAGVLAQRCTMMALDGMECLTHAFGRDLPARHDDGANDACLLNPNPDRGEL